MYKGQLIFFRSCRYNTGPISDTKLGSEHIFEIGIFEGIIICTRCKSFKSFSNEYIFVQFVCFSIISFSFFFKYFCVLAGIFQFICWSGRVLLSFSFNILNCNSGHFLLCLFTSSNRFLFRLTLRPAFLFF